MTRTKAADLRGGQLIKLATGEHATIERVLRSRVNGEPCVVVTYPDPSRPNIPSWNRALVELYVPLDQVFEVVG